MALEPVDTRMGYERLGGLVRERMQAEPRSKALFVFVGKRGHTMKVLTWDGAGAIIVHKKLDAGKFELPKPTRVGDQHVIVSDAIFEVIYKGIASAPKTPRKRIHYVPPAGRPPPAVEPTMPCAAVTTSVDVTRKSVQRPPFPRI